jgi:hypothetical protein
VKFLEKEREDSTQLAPLPAYYTADSDPDILERYSNAVTARISDSTVLKPHQDITDRNVSLRLRHIKCNSQNTDRSHSTVAYEAFRIASVASTDVEERIRRFATETHFSSLELVTLLEAGNPPRTVAGDLARHAFGNLIDLDQVTEESSKQRIRGKFQRPIEVGNALASVVTTKTDGFTIRYGDDQLLDVKSRESGFVMSDDEQLNAEERKALRILSNLHWGDGVPEEATEAFRAEILPALQEKNIFHPTISVLFLARHSTKG